MKIHILFLFKDTPTGGGNQFLKILKKYLIKNNFYTENIADADIILFNSYQYIDQLIKVKKKYPDKIFIHRVDGPIKLYNNLYDRRDNIIFTVNKFIADGTVFQSEWSKNMNFKIGLNKSKFYTVIPNTVDDEIFNNNKIKFSKNKKIKIISSSWSSNMNKGFDIYNWLDNNLDFNKYDMTFVGRSPIIFKNIKLINPMPSKELAGLLKKNDIFLTASKNDPCSNALLEALACGLPAIVYNSGGHPEIIKDFGEKFNEKEEIILLLEKISNNYEFYKKKIKLSDINEIGLEYCNFFYSIKKDINNSKSRNLSFLKYFIIINELYLWRFHEKLNSLLNVVSLKRI